MNSIMIAVSKKEVLQQIEEMKGYMISAAEVTEHSSLEQIVIAKEYLNIAKGIFNTLKSLKVLNRWEDYGENLDRIDDKHREILWHIRRIARAKSKRA